MSQFKAASHEDVLRNSAVAIELTEPVELGIHVLQPNIHARNGTFASLPRTGTMPTIVAVVVLGIEADIRHPIALLSLC